MQQLRPAFVLVGGLVVGVTAAGQVAVDLAHRSQAGATARMVQIAQAAVDPPGLTVLDRGACPGLGEWGRCLEGSADADTVARDHSAALTKAAGRPASSRCETLPVGKPRPRSCLVRIDAGEDHAVLIWVDSRVVYRTVSGSKPLGQLRGSRVNISPT